MNRYSHVLWLNAAEAYDFNFVVAAAPGRNPSLRVVAGGSDCTDYDKDLSGLVEIPSTAGWDDYQTISV